jgi:hypothetical protein
MIKNVLFVVILTNACVLKMPPITFTQSGTAAEKQMIGEEKHIEKDGWILSSIRSSATGSEIWERENLTKNVAIDHEDPEFISALRVIAYFAPEINRYKKKFFIGEALDGKVKLNPLLKETRFHKEYDNVQNRLLEVIKNVNSARELIYNKRVQFIAKEKIDEKSIEQKKSKALLVYYNMVEIGEYYESSKNKWIKKD